MPKNIIVLSDGTGQDGGRGHDSNVYKLFRMLEDRTENQIVFYDEGLGTDTKKVTGSAAGAGFSKNILQCYHFIYDNYEAGDKIFLFGFSRGAATVRSLAAFIHYFGMLPKARPELIERAWDLYRAGRKERHDEEETTAKKNTGRRGPQDEDLTPRDTFSDSAKQFIREHPNQWASIEFLGVWDTVPALGLVPLKSLNLLINTFPMWKHGFHDFKLQPSVKHAYHALSIDDDRLWFHPTIWKECGPGQTVQQVWFSGSHTDVGGGFMAAGLPDVTLEWMVEKAVFHGIRLHLRSRRDWNFVIAPDATDREHPPRAGIGRVYAPALRDKVWDQQAFDSFGPPKLHQSVIDRARHDPNYRPWALKQYAQYLTLLPAKFADWLKEQHNLDYDRAFEEYLTRMRGGAGATDDAAAQPPASRGAWLAKNPYDGWLARNYPDYQQKLHGTQNAAEMQAWLEGYPRYQEWLAAMYPQLRPTEFGNIVIEPYSELYEYDDKDGVHRFSNEEIDGKTAEMQGYTNVREFQLRDYDRETLKGMIERGLAESPRGANAFLLDRVILVKPIEIEEDEPQDKPQKRAKKVIRKWTNRYIYDSERWYGK